MNSERLSRREFLKGTAALAGTVMLSSCNTGPSAKHTPTAVDQVTLGKTGLKMSRLGIGTGSKGGSIQRALGADGFNRLIHYAYDHGITYIDTAESYRTHTMVREAIKDLPREKLFIQSKMPGVPEKPLEVLDRYRRELGVDYIDSLLTHCGVTANWDDERRRVLDALEEAKDKKIIRAHGISCHSLPALKTAAELDWVDVNLVRINPQGAHIDTPAEEWKSWLEREGKSAKLTLPIKSSMIPNLIGSRWRITFEGTTSLKPYVFTLKPDGEYSYTKANTQKKHRYEIQGNRITFTINDGYATYTGVIHNRNSMSGKAINIKDKNWTWKAERQQ